MTLRRVRGSTLIELMITIAILALILAAGVPQLASWLANVRARNAADSLQNGIRLAQTEAVRANASVTLTMTADVTPTVGSSPSATGLNWIITDASGNKIQAKTSEGQTGVTMSPIYSSGTFAGTIQFDGLGRTSITAPIQFKYTPASGGDHPMSVMLTPAGRVRLCDPTRSTGDPQACE